MGINTVSVYTTESLHVANMMVTLLVTEHQLLKNYSLKEQFIWWHYMTANG